MHELLVQKRKRKIREKSEKKRETEKKIIDHMIGLKKGAKFSRCIAVFFRELE